MSENSKKSWWLLLLLIPISIASYAALKRKKCTPCNENQTPPVNTSSSGALGTSCYCNGSSGSLGVWVSSSSGSLGLVCYCSGSLGLIGFNSWRNTNTNSNWWFKK